MPHKPETRRRLNAEYRERHREKIRDHSREWRADLKQEALRKYGMYCKHCGFDDARALQIDHVDNDGAQERKKLGGQNFSGWRFYVHLKKNGWPDGYQTLCANCNIIKFVESSTMNRHCNTQTTAAA